jgi:hypothetical protein
MRSVNFESPVHGMNMGEGCKQGECYCRYAYFESSHSQILRVQMDLA